MATGVPALAKLHAIKHLVSKFLAIKLLKETELDSSNACLSLAAALSPSILTGFLYGSRLTVANLLICYNAYIKVRAPGSRAYSSPEILTTLTRFRSFILIIIKPLAALGLHAESLMTLVDSAMAIEEAGPPDFTRPPDGDARREGVRVFGSAQPKKKTNVKKIVSAE
jgi:hypothetical protein